MSVVVETTLGDITVDLFTTERPRACQNFLKLCKIKYYNFNLFHTVSRRFIAQTGDPTGSRNGGESIYGVLDGPLKRFFVAETNPRIKHTVKGLISFVGNEENMIGSQFFFTLGDDLTYLDDKHCVFGEVAEGLDVLDLINEAICDSDDRPYQDIRITHTVILDDPLPDLEEMVIPSRSPSPSAERLQGGRIAPDEEIDEIAGKSAEEINEMIAEREAKARATILEMVGDLPDAEMAPPENVLFVCKLNPVTSDDDLEIIFSRFGKIVSSEVIRDHKTGDSLQYAFIEFAEKKSCEDAYFKMDNVLIDDRRIHVDFSQSVSKVKWMGKGRGVKHFPENGNNNKNTEGFDRDKQSRKYNKHEQKHFSSEKYDTSARHHRRNRTPSPRRKKDNHYRRSRSISPQQKKYNRRSRSSSPQYKKNNRRVKSPDRKRYSPSRKFKRTENKSRSRSISPRGKINKSVKSRNRSPSLEYKKNKNKKSRSSSRESRSISPAYKKSKQKSSSRRRSPSQEYKRNKSRQIRSRSKETEYKSNKQKKSKSRRSRSRDRSDRSQSPEIKKSKSSRNRSPPKYKKKRGHSSDDRTSSSPEIKKSKSTRNRSSTPEERKKSRYRSSSSEVEDRKHHKGSYKKK